jgi:hypothetical protein
MLLVVIVWSLGMIGVSGFILLLIFIDFFTDAWGSAPTAAFLLMIGIVVRPLAVRAYKDLAR